MSGVVGRARAARLVLRVLARRAGVQVVEPGQPDALEPGRPALVVHRPGALYTGLAKNVLRGAAESWLEGDWTTPDLGGVVAAFARVTPFRTSAVLQRFRASAALVRRAAGNDGRTGSSRDQIAHHYDLPTEFFASFLGPMMVYSAASVPEVEQVRLPELADAELCDRLAVAQAKKLTDVLDAAQVGAGSRVLDLGCGWGSLALAAADRGASVTAVTLSAGQADHVRTAGAGVGVEVRNLDYRQVGGTYDCVTSVEMIEAVGHDHLAAYFGVIARSLASGGRAVVQAIVMAHGRAVASVGKTTWIQERIFPGGFIPSLRMIEEAARDAGLVLADAPRSLREGYAGTLQLWAEGLRRATSRGELDGVVTRRAAREWEFYLEYSRGGFQSAYLDVLQLTFVEKRR